MEVGFELLRRLFAMSPLVDLSSKKVLYHLSGVVSYNCSPVPLQFLIGRLLHGLLLLPPYGNLLSRPLMPFPAMTISGIETG